MSCEILYMPWVERHIINENKKASESELKEKDNDVEKIIEQLIIYGKYND